MAHLIPFEGYLPIVGNDVWLAETACVIGHATLGNQVSVWYGAVIRADIHAIVIGARSNIQDNAVVHVTSDHPVDQLPDSRGSLVGCRIGEDVTVGHSAVVHACTVGNRVLVGIGSILLDGAVIGSDVVVAAGSVVPPNAVIPDGVMVMGRPAKVVRTLTEKDRFWSTAAANMYVGYTTRYGIR